MNWEGYEVEGQMDITEFLDKGENMTENEVNMTENEAKILLCQMYLPHFDEEEKQALTIAIQALEELKAYKQGNCTNDCKHYDSAIEYVRNKAIDEFAEKIQWEYLNSCGLKQREIDFLVAVSSMVAEQMKGGTENE